MKKNVTKIGIALFALLFLQTSAYAITGFGWLKGSGKIISETRELGSFHSLKVGGAFEVILIKATKEKIVLEVDDNLMPYITTKTFGGVLEIDNEKEFRNPTRLKAIVYYVSIDELTISGAAELSSEDVLKSADLEIEASGASEVVLQLDTDLLDAEISGASQLKLSGRATVVIAEASGASDYIALELEADSYDMDASGASHAKIWVNSKLNLEASGASSVLYKGNPSIDIIDLSGASSVKKY
ncbi:MAG TPA: hypothetical protein DCG69_03775 [Bacteroidales bacterium]|nr:hypothetical protein [Bacteroidales bacterium]